MKRRIGAWGLRLTRWKTDGHPPEARRYVAIAAPHTTNWDLLYLLLHAWYHDLPMSWLGKATLFRWPAGPVLRRLGGIPVERDSKTGLSVRPISPTLLDEREAYREPGARVLSEADCVPVDRRENDR